jgi:hypothetical protein
MIEVLRIIREPFAYVGRPVELCQYHLASMDHPLEIKIAFVCQKLVGTVAGLKTPALWLWDLPRMRLFRINIS